jgi:hypothetical protein
MVVNVVTSIVVDMAIESVEGGLLKTLAELTSMPSYEL